MVSIGVILYSTGRSQTWLFTVIFLAGVALGMAAAACYLFRDRAISREEVAAQVGAIEATQHMAAAAWVAREQLRQVHRDGTGG